MTGANKLGLAGASLGEGGSGLCSLLTAAAAGSL
jgi:hypothetical protein